MREDKMMDSRINRIARKLVIAAGNNVFDDYFTFYSDGRFVVENVRNLINVVNKLLETSGNYNTNIQKIDEYVGYLSEVKLDEMNTSSSVKEIKQIIKDIKKSYDKYEKSEDEEVSKLLEDYNDLLEKLKEFLIAYESSCVSSFKTRFVEDEDNVNSLLETIRECGNDVLNK